MANSYAFVLSKNTYPDAWQANFLGVDQGTMIVYASTDTLSSSTVLFADSRLTQPIYGNPDLWLGAQLLTNDSVKYAVAIGDDGAVDPVSNPTTTTTVGPTTTTTSAPTTTTTSASTTTTASPYTTSTTQAAISETAIGNFNSFDACSGVGNNLTIYHSGSLGVGSALYMDAGLTVPYNPGSAPSGNGVYLRIYFQAQDQLCTMSGNIILGYTAC